MKLERGLFRATLAALATLSLVSISGPDLRAEGAPAVPPATSSSPAVSSRSRSPWSVAVYHSVMTDNSLSDVLTAHVTLHYGFLDSVDVSYQVAENLFEGHPDGSYPFWRPFAGSLSVAGNLTRRTGDPNGPMFEFDSYVLWRSRHVPVSPFLASTFAVGDGVSYATRVPAREVGGQHLMNFLTLEGTLGLPSHRGVDLVLRVHHRCDAWGLFGPGAATNALGMGVRYSF